MTKKNKGGYEKKTEKMVTLQKDLQKELQKGDIHYGSNIKYSSELVIGYLYRKFPASYSVAQRILREILIRFPQKAELNHVLDFGSGLGSGSLALYELLKDRANIPQIYSVEPNY